MGKTWFEAAKKGDIKMLEKCLDKKSKRKSTSFSINDYNEFKNTAIHLTVMNKHLYAAKFLLQHNAMVDIVDGHHNTPLHLSVWTDQLEFVELMLSYSSNSVNSVNELGETPLHMSAKSGNYLIMELLLNADGNPYIQNRDQQTVLCVACQYGKEDIIHILLQTDPNHVRNHPNPGSPLYLAAAFGKLSVLKILLHNGIEISSRVSSTGKTALHAAVANCRPEIVRFLLEKKIDATIEDYEGHSALDICQQVRASETDFEIYNMLHEHLKKLSESVMASNSESLRNNSKPLIPPKPKGGIVQCSPVSKQTENPSFDDGLDDDDVFSQDSIIEDGQSITGEVDDVQFHTNRVSVYKAHLKAIIDEDASIEDIESVLIKMKKNMAAQ